MLPKIIPTILTKSEEDLKRKIKVLEDLVDRVQIDVVDGIFTAGRTVPLEVFSQIESSLSLEIHLMVKDPFSYLSKCAQVLANRVIVQIEPITDQEDFITRAIEAGFEPGLALDLGTGLNELNEKALSATDVVLLMGYKAGFGGGEFNSRVFEKIKKLKKIKEEGGFLFKIMVDGGLTKENILKVVQAGADELCVGSAIFSQKNPARAIEELRKILTKEF